MISFVNFLRKSAFAALLTLSALVLAGPGGFGTPSAYASVVSSISVSGNSRVEAETIRSYISIKTGKSFDAADIDDSVKQLYGTGLFTDVRISVSGSRLLITVVEAPIVNSVILQGNKKVKSDVLVPLLQLKPRASLTDAKLKGDEQTIKDYYATQGRSLASVDAKVTNLPNNRADVVFVISDGMRTGISSINFVGNKAFPNTRLASVIVSRKHNLLSFLTRKDVFDEAKVAADEEALRRFYMSHGYADFRVVSADWSFDEAKGRYSITYTLEEGERYTFAAVTIDSTIPGVNTGSLQRLVKTKAGQEFNANDVEKTVTAMTIALSQEGYAFAQVRPRGDRDYDKHTIQLTYLIDEGPRAYIERIDIYGNTKTRDYVIRREFEVAEGDPYNRVLIDQTERNLRNLGFFKTVAVTTEPGSAPDKVVVNVNVEEQSTGDIGVGVGVSTSGLIAEISLNEKNFLGRGQALRITVGFGQQQQNYELSFTDPHFLGTNILAGIDLVQSNLQATSFRPFDNTVSEGTLRIGLPLTDNLTFNTSYRASEQTISNTRKSTSMYFPNGSTFTSLVNYSIVYSTVDNRMDPREGVLCELRAGLRRPRWRCALHADDGRGALLSGDPAATRTWSGRSAAEAAILPASARRCERSTTSSRAAKRSAASRTTAMARSTKPPRPRSAARTTGMLRPRWNSRCRESRVISDCAAPSLPTPVRCGASISRRAAARWSTTMSFARRWAARSSGLRRSAFCAATLPMSSPRQRPTRRSSSGSAPAARFDGLQDNRGAAGAPTAPFA